MQAPGKPKKTNMIIAAIAIVVVIVVVLAIIMMSLGGGRGSPDGTVKSALTAFNNYDAKAYVDCTMAKFAPASEYNTILNEATTGFAVFKAYSNLGGKIAITGSDYSTKSSAVMSLTEKNEATSYIDSLPGQNIVVTVTDYATVSFTMTVTGSLAGLGLGSFIPSGPVDMLLVQVNGQWYLANTGFGGMDGMLSD